MTLDNSEKKNKLFISFSSLDLPVVREIMSGLKFQKFEFWDYSDELQQISLLEEIKPRLLQEIDNCDYFIALVSKNSMDKKKGRFPYFEVDYAVNTKELHLKKRIIVVEIGSVNDNAYAGPFEYLREIRHFNFVRNDFLKESVKSHVGLIKGICNATGQEYTPQLSPHHRLPFWEKFRDEVLKLTHTNHEHTFLMNVISEFAEYYRNENIKLAYEAISFFVASCVYLIPEYEMVYPFIVKAVIEQDLGLNQKAAESYENALKNNHNNPDALGGLGMVCLNEGDYNKATQYFEKAYLVSEGNQRLNERLNLIISKISGGDTITYEEKEFVEKLDYLDVVLDDEKELSGATIISESSDESAISDQLKQRFEEQRIFILTTRALLYYVEALSQNERSALELLQKAYEIYAHEIGEEKLPNAVSVFYFCTISKYLGKREPEKIYERAISRFSQNKIELKELYGFLADHYYEENNLNKSISIYRKQMITGRPGRKILASYARLLKAAGSNEYKDICDEILDYDLNGYPETAEDFYWDGYANFLLGKLDRARYDFERSFHYDVYYNN